MTQSCEYYLIIIALVKSSLEVGNVSDKENRFMH